ncbi:MAG: DUF3305 domain-containing protein [Gammaproteobacteria bacterium]|nr:DUF3305 domain-containing protein [Gammaproteobacteria bacterium]
MNTTSLPGDTAVPDYFDISVIMEARRSHSVWIDEEWSAVGVSAGVLFDAHEEAQEILHEKGVRRLLYPGFRIMLHVDECESYYHNLMAPHPSCYVVADIDEKNRPIPFLVTLSFDEAHAYLEGDQEVYAVNIPPELYRWSEAYVLSHYVPQKKRKRKLDNWKKQSGRRHEAG